MRDKYVRAALSGLLSMVYLVFNTRQAPFDDGGCVRPYRWQLISVSLPRRFCARVLNRLRFVPHLLKTIRA